MPAEEKALTGRERQIAALAPHQFKPGQSGNPSGRPKNALTKALRKQLADLESDGAERTKAEALAAKVLELALGGNLEAAKIIFDRMEGRPRQRVSVTTDSRERVEGSVARLIEAAGAEGDALTRRDALALLAEQGDEEAQALLDDEES